MIAGFVKWLIEWSCRNIHSLLEEPNKRTLTLYNGSLSTNQWGRIVRHSGVEAQIYIPSNYNQQKAWCIKVAKNGINEKGKSPVDQEDYDLWLPSWIP